MLLVVLLYALFSFSFTLGKMIVQNTQPLFAIGIRMLVGGAILLFYEYVIRGNWVWPTKKDFFYYAQVTTFYILLPYITRLYALRTIATGKASLLYNLIPFFTAIYAHFLIKEKLTKLKVLSLFIGFAGMLPLLYTSDPEQADIIGIFSIAEIFVIFGVAALSYGLIIIQKMVKDKGYSPVIINGMSMFWGGLISLTASFIFESGFVFETTKPILIGSAFTVFATLGGQIIISNIICQNLQANLLKTYSSVFLSFFNFLNPIFTSFYGYLIFNEYLTWHFFASFTIVVFALGLYHYDDRMKKNGYFVSSE